MTHAESIATSSKVNTFANRVHISVHKSRRSTKIPYLNVMLILAMQAKKSTAYENHVQFDTDSDYSLFTYVDGLTSNISHYLSELYIK